MDTIPDLAHYEAVLAAALAGQPAPAAITGYGLVQQRRLVCGVGDLAGGGRGLARYRVIQVPLRPGLELVVVFAANAAGLAPDPARHMPAIERCLDQLRALDRAYGLRPGGPPSPPPGAAAG